MLAAAAQRVVGGAMRLRLAPRSETERARLRDDPALPDVLGQTFQARDLVRTDTVVMALTGVTDGPLLDGIRENEPGCRADTLLLTPDDGVQRRSAAS
jgi:fructose-1,6-bisphosphatase II